MQLLRQQSLREEKVFIHPRISFVLIHDGKYYCAKHPKPNGMNAGSMRQHLRGDAHKIDFETGNPIKKIKNFSEIIKELQNQESIKSKRELFDDYYYIVPKIFELKDRAQAMIITNNFLEGKKRVDVVNHLISLYNDENPSKPNLPYTVN